MNIDVVPLGVLGVPLCLLGSTLASVWLSFGFYGAPSASLGQLLEILKLLWDAIGFTRSAVGCLGDFLGSG